MTGSHDRRIVASGIHCTYPTMATLAIPERRTLTFDEALVSVTCGYPDFVFIRRGAHVLRLGKYDPWVFSSWFLKPECRLRPPWSEVCSDFE
jgi:hypothetical protein